MPSITVATIAEAIILAAGQHSPGDARQLVGDGDDHFAARVHVEQAGAPIPEPSGGVLDAMQYLTGSMD